MGAGEGGVGGEDAKAVARKGVEETFGAYVKARGCATYGESGRVVQNSQGEYFLVVQSFLRVATC